MNQRNQRIYYSQEAAQRARQQQTGLALAMLVLGISLGTILALLFAPRSGDETRQSLADIAEQAYNDGRDATNNAVENLQEDLERLRKDIDERLKTLQG
jgi:gas vesicle protein